jgi:putative membrane protein
MIILENAIVLIVAAIHLFFSYKEFSDRNDPRFYEKFKIVLAKDQDLTQIGRIIANAATFNALLGIGLIVSFIAREQGYLLKIYLLVSIIIAGIVGGVTLKPTVAVLQSGPAAIALALILLAPGAA